MDPGGSRGEGDVGPVVHQDRDAERRDQRARALHQLPRRGALEPELDRRGPAALGGERERHEIATLDQAVVGDEHEPNQLPLHYLP